MFLINDKAFLARKSKFLLDPARGADVIIVTRGRNAVYNRVLKLL